MFVIKYGPKLVDPQQMVNAGGEFTGVAQFQEGGLLAFHFIDDQGEAYAAVLEMIEQPGSANWALVWWEDYETDIEAVDPLILAELGLISDDEYLRVREYQKEVHGMWQ